MNEPLAPIAVFVYKRPEHTRRTLEALAKNEGIESSTVYFFCDGPKPNADASTLKAIEETRQMVRSFNAAKEHIVNALDENKGLRDSIVQGISDVLSQHETVIVLEDDIETSPAFLGYMNDALRLYSSQERVMHISGYWYPLKSQNLPETFFYNAATCWGWATWRRAWDKLNLDAAYLLKAIKADEQRLNRFTLNGKADFLGQLEMNHDGRMRTWAVFWHAAILLNNGLSLHPSISYTRNIGIDGSGEHQLISDMLNWNHLNQINSIEIQPLKESDHAVKVMERFYVKLHSNSLSKRVIDKLKSIIQ